MVCSEGRVNPAPTVNQFFLVWYLLLGVSGLFQGYLGGINAHLLPVFPKALVFDDSGDGREEGIISALSHIGSGMNLGAALAGDDGAGVDPFTPKGLHPTALAV